MYSVVLATLLTTGADVPQFGHGCHGCSGWSCHGCHGCHGCCGGCYGCSGCCGGGCYGCGGCFGCAGMIMAPPAMGRVATGHAMADDGRNAATVVVQLPRDANLYVEGQLVRLTDGQFTTPVLQPGQNFVYTVKAEAVRGTLVVSEVKEVRVKAGETSRVGFSNLATPAPVLKPEGIASQITVRLPEKAKLYVNDVLSAQTAATRTFVTPTLDADTKYAYTLRAEIDQGGKTVTETKKIVFKAGEAITVDFGTVAAAAGEKAAQR